MVPHRSLRDTLVVLFRTTFWDAAALILRSLIVESWKREKKTSLKPKELYLSTLKLQ